MKINKKTLHLSARDAGASWGAHGAPTDVWYRGGGGGGCCGMFIHIYLYLDSDEQAFLFLVYLCVVYIYIIRDGAFFLGGGCI